MFEEKMTPDALMKGECTIPAVLSHWASVKGNVTALREKKFGVWQCVTWAEYHERSQLVALGLQKLGLKRGDRIVIASEDTQEWLYADVGAQMLGLETVGIYPTNPWPELQYITRHCGARAAICGDQEQVDKVLEAVAQNEGLPDLAHIFCVDMKGLRNYAPGKPASFAALMQLGRDALVEDPQAGVRLQASIKDLSPDEIAILVYTSGTTGPPKGARLSHRNFIYSAYAYAEAVGMLNRPYESVCYLPLCHAAERCYGMIMHLVLGGRMNFAESIDTVSYNIREIAPTFFLGVPRIWEKLQQNFTFRIGEAGWLQRKTFAWGMRRGRVLSDAKAARGGTRTLLETLEWWLIYGVLFRSMQRHMGLNRSHSRLCGGAAVSPETLRFFEIIGLPVSQGYGLTESGGLAFAQRQDRPWVAGNCGPALRGSAWKLGDDGEIFIRSPGVFHGYLNDPTATDNVLSSDKWLASGDIVETRGDEIVVVDRKKAIIITSGGKNIAPSEIENALKDSPYVREVIVVGEGKNFLGALIQIDFETVGRWASERDIVYTTFKSLTAEPAVRELIDGIVTEVNGRFARVENIRKFVLLEKELDQDDGELTATQKVRRGLVNKKFAKELIQIYGAA